MFERFTHSARAVLVNAQAEARGLRHNYIGTEHLLLGLTTGEGTAARLLGTLGVDRDVVWERVLGIVGEGPHGEPDAEALRSIGIDLDEVRRHIEEAFGPGALDRARRARAGRSRRWRRRSSDCSGGHIPFTPRAKKVLEIGLREVLRLKDGFIGTEHILLGLLREDGGVAAMILAEQDVGYNQVLNWLREERGRSVG